jgi:hypothetical protein
MAKRIWAMPEEHWIDDSPRIEDTEQLKKEAAGDSNIDDGNLRSDMVSMWQRGEVEIRVRELPGRTRVVFLGTDEQWSKIPWDLWSRIFQAIGHPVGYTLFYAHPKKREFPALVTEPIKSLHMNAGYSYICQQQIVVVYRFEEATRVLLHELLHTACFDSGMAVEDLEANTEAWTEVFLCAILSKGSPGTFTQLWNKQISWINAQTAYLYDTYNVRSPADYVWRYTIGRHRVLLDKGYINPSNKAMTTAELSLRFTTPEWPIM